MNTNFNIFRINCWLDDIDGNNFTNSITSLIYDFLFSNENKETLASDIFINIKDNLSINLDEDFFNNIIDKNKKLEKYPTDNDVLVKLSQEKYDEINENISNNSLEYHIEKFIIKKGYDSHISEKIIQLLANTLYENILVFSTEKIKTFLSNSYTNNFTQNEVDAYNEFIDYDNREKNNAIFSTFLKAVEFAILTSGRGVKNISKDIFKNKTYYLDTNVIIRILGVGGKERQKTVEKLLDSCTHEGIKFEVSHSTEKELNNKIEERCENLRKKSDLHSITILQKLTEEIGLNQDFESHYAKLRVNGDVKSVNSYELYLKSKYQQLKANYNLKGESLLSKLEGIEINELTHKLFSAKKDDFSVRYTKTAAKIDAINVLYVRKLRGRNDYNYNDIRSFYLTTDRTLNKVLSMQNNKKIPETILPSQLFLLHNSAIETDENDIKQFVKFIKKRTTEFKLNGTEVLKFASEIRDITSNVEDLTSILKAYSDTKYKSTVQEVKKFSKISTFNDFAKTQVDKELWETRKGNKKYSDALESAITSLNNKLKRSKSIAYILEYTIYLLFSIITYYITNQEKMGILSFLFLSVISLSVNFIFKDSFGIHKFLKNKIYFWYIKNSHFYKLFGNDDQYILKAKELIENNTK
ncbi:hypothetical protein ACE01N_03115 [Saccharicrinis sp. FJH2]|uniref:hypothetical protein n=1 Tax=Saccharicrinis sp. FJH65 TaxID=3344659 RepID=UPI0035F2C06E